jgi:protein TonB
MFDKLIESKKNGKENAKQVSSLLTTSVLIFSMLFSATLWSLYAKNLSVAEEDLTLSSIVMPVPLADTTPPKPEPIQKIEKKLSASSDKPQVAIRNQNVARIDETQPIPDKISTQPSNVKSRPNTLYKIAQGKETDYVGQTSSRNSNNEGETSGISNSKQNDKVSKNEIDEPPPIVKKKVEEKTKVEEKVKVEEKTKVPNKVSGGVLNGKAISLPKPNYSATAKAVGASGDVQVQVLIDERGNVVSANAISGSPLLRPDAEKAARQAKFSPTYLSDQAVKVSGLIVYRFTK